MNQFLLHTAILLLAVRQHSPAACVKSSSDRNNRRIHMPPVSLRRSGSSPSPNGRRIAHTLPVMLRCAGSSAAGSIFGTAVLLLSRSYYAYIAAECLAILPLMTLMAFGRSDPALFLKHYACCFGSAIILGGLVTALENIAGISQVPFLSALIAFIIAGRCLNSMRQNRRILSLIVPVSIEHNGRITELLGFYDTGNLLRDPYGGRPVHLLRASKLPECGINSSDFLGLVLYQALGSTGDMLEIYKVDFLNIYTNNSTQPFASHEALQLQTHPAVIAGVPEELFTGKEYDMILNPEITELSRMPTLTQ